MPCIPTRPGIPPIATANYAWPCSEVGRSRSRNPASGWWVSDDVIFPYKDKSFIAPAPEKKAGDDGHGHSH